MISGDSDSHMEGLQKLTWPVCNNKLSLSLFPCPLSHHLPPLSFYLHLSTPAKKFKKVVGKETYSETLESTPSLEKEKFPQDYFPEVGNVIRTLD